MWSQRRCCWHWSNLVFGFVGHSGPPPTPRRGKTKGPESERVHDTACAVWMVLVLQCPSTSKLQRKENTPETVAEVCRRPSGKPGRIFQNQSGAIQALEKKPFMQRAWHSHEKIRSAACLWTNRIFRKFEDSWNKYKQTRLPKLTDYQKVTENIFN